MLKHYNNYKLNFYLFIFLELKSACMTEFYRGLPRETDIYRVKPSAIEMKPAWAMCRITDLKVIGEKHEEKRKKEKQFIETGMHIQCPLIHYVWEH